MILRGKNKGKSNTFTFVSLLLLVSLALYFLVLEPLVFNKTVFKDYGSAGTYIREQMAQSKSPIKFTCNTTEYNMIVMSDSVRPHRQQPTRLPRPWDSPGKNSGVGRRFLLQCMKVKNESEVIQSGLTLRDPMD